MTPLDFVAFATCATAILWCAAFVAERSEQLRRDQEERERRELEKHERGSIEA